MGLFFFSDDDVIQIAQIQNYKMDLFFNYKVYLLFFCQNFVIQLLSV